MSCHWPVQKLLRGNFSPAHDNQARDRKRKGRGLFVPPPLRILKNVPDVRLIAQAAWPFLASRTLLPSPMFTLICLGLASARLPNLIFRTPLL